MTDIKPSNIELPNIELPNIETCVPNKDSYILHKLKKSKNLSLLYVYLCNQYKKGNGKITPKKIMSELKFGIAYAHQLLNDFAICGYLKKIKNDNRVFYTFQIPITNFVRDDLVKATKKWFD